MYPNLQNILGGIFYQYKVWWYISVLTFTFLRRTPTYTWDRWVIALRFFRRSILPVSESPAPSSRNHRRRTLFLLMWNRLSLNTPSSGTAVMFRQTGLCSPPTSSQKSKSVYTSTLFIWMYSTEIQKSPRHSNEEFILNRVLDDKMVQVNNKTLMYQNFQIKTYFVQKLSSVKITYFAL